MPKTDGLRPRQQRFVEEYLIDLNATQAAIRAGYSAKTARKIASEILTKPDVQAAIAAMKEKRAAKMALTQEFVITKLVENLDRAMQAEPVRDAKGNETGEYTYQGSVANRALELLGKHQGMFADRQEHRGSVVVEIIDPTRKC